jgi:hypothetical protein
MIKTKLVIIALCSLYGCSNLAQAFDLSEDGKWKLKTMLRLRFETDWDVFRVTGTPRPERDRIRLAGNTELQYLPTKELSFGLRLGMANDNRNAYGNIDLIDFQNNKKPSNNIYLDKWFTKFNTDNWWVWGGRNAIPFWQQNEFFWEPLSTPAGLAFGGSSKYQQHNLAFSLGHFATPDGKYRFNGQFTSIQGVDTLKTNDFSATAALGFFMFHGHKGAQRSFTGDGSRDYKIVMANLQYVHNLWDKPLTLGADGFWNAQPYSANSFDAYTALHHNEVLGGVLSVKYGANANSGDWLVSYSYAYIQALAVNGDFTQSDWSRYDPSGADMHGHDFKASYTFNKYVTLVARTILAERISTQERGNRFRLDAVFNF